MKETGKVMEAGALQGDDYCQMFLNVDMGECNGCPDYTRRIEVYSNRDTGCGDEFFVSGGTGDGGDNGNGGNSGGGSSGGDGGVPPIEEGASKVLLGSATLAAALMALY